MTRAQHTFGAVGIAVFGFFVIGGLFLLGVVGYVVMTATPAQSEAPHTAVSASHADQQRTRGLIAQAVETKVVKRVDVANHEAQVFLAAWQAFDADAKRGLVAELARYCDYAGTNHNAQYVTVIDAESGRQLATYDPFGVHLK